MKKYYIDDIEEEMFMTAPKQSSGNIKRKTSTQPICKFNMDSFNREYKKFIETLKKRK